MRITALLLLFVSTSSFGFDICVQKKLKVKQICGYVIDSGGVRVPDADISIVDAKGEKRVLRTDKKGAFRFDKLRVGKYELRANYMQAMNAWAPIELVDVHTSTCQRPIKIRLKTGIPRTCSEVSLEKKSDASQN